MNELIETIKEAIRASEVKAGVVANCEWKRLAKEAWEIASDLESPAEELLWEISKLRGTGNALMMNAHSLLIVAKNLVRDLSANNPA